MAEVHFVLWLEDWKIGRLEDWKIGGLEDWSDKEADWKTTLVPLWKRILGKIIGGFKWRGSFSFLVYDVDLFKPRDIVDSLAWEYKYAATWVIPRQDRSILTRIWFGCECCGDLWGFWIGTWVLCPEALPRLRLRVLPRVPALEAFGLLLASDVWLTQSNRSKEDEEPSGLGSTFPFCSSSQFTSSATSLSSFSLQSDKTTTVSAAPTTASLDSARTSTPPDSGGKLAVISIGSHPHRSSPIQHLNNSRESTKLTGYPLTSRATNQLLPKKI